jgi:hypothetical protein
LKLGHKPEDYMQLQERINLLAQLGDYMQGNDEAWSYAKQKAFAENNWFIPEFVEHAIKQTATGLLQKEQLKAFASTYTISEPSTLKRIGIVLTGTTPLAGFHDIVCTFLTGHYAFIKASAKDETLIKHLVAKLNEWSAEADTYFSIATIIKGCDAYMATESRGATLSFAQYFSKYPSIIRKPKTSVAIVSGNESNTALEKLADDIHLYFGLGPHNVTKLYVPEGYDFVPLLGAFKRYEYFSNHHKFKNNYDYNLSVQILNNHYYMTNGSILLVESKNAFSPISQLHYEFYKDEKQILNEINQRDDVEAIIGQYHLPFGEANSLALTKFENNSNTVEFLKTLAN